MGTIWIRELTGGLDARRMPETTPGGSLIRAVDGHINRGGEFEKRAAFKRVFDLPVGTLGLAAGANGLVTFGSGPAPQMPAGISYQRIQAPTGAWLTKLLSTTRFSNVLYAVGLYSDAKRYHFYNGALVGDWFDQQARAVFTVKSGAGSGLAKAVGTFKNTAYNSAGTTNDSITAVYIGGVNLLAAPYTYTPGQNARDGIMSGLAFRITQNKAVSGYAATYDVGTQTFTITAEAAGSAPNGKTISVSNVAGSGTTFGNFVAMAGGTNTVPVLNQIKVGGVNVMAAPVPYTGDPGTMATAIAKAITDAALGYTADAVGAKVTIAAVSLAPGEFGKTVVFEHEGMVFEPAADITMATGGSFTPGDFVATIGTKVYSVSGPAMHFSGIKAPTKWQPETLGAGFIDMSAEASGSEELKAVAEYQQYVAVFAEETILIWYVDPDPALNKKAQVLRNTGTVSARSVVQFGDSDLFYLDESGVRSLKARDASNAAATSDIGVPIDTLLIDKLKTLTDAERNDIMAAIEPRDGRFWLIVKDRIFVFSYFPGSKVSAWSEYTPTITEEGSTELLEIDDVAVYKRNLYVRAGDAVYVYGGLGTALDYDETEAELWLPYLDAETPTLQKHLDGIDVACEGTWNVAMAMQPNNLDAVDDLGTVEKTTFNADRHPAQGSSTHFSLRFRSSGPGPRKLGAAVIHYTASQDED